MRYIFKKYEHDQIHGNSLEYLGEAESVVDKHEQIYDIGHFPSEDGKTLFDEQGNTIWEEGDTTVDGRDTWIMYEKEPDDLTSKELFEILTSNRMMRKDFDELLKLNEYNLPVFRIAEALDLIHLYLIERNEADIMGTVTLCDDLTCDISVVDDNGIEKGFKIK